mgnify:CR=1 FL=1
MAFKQFEKSKYPTRQWLIEGEAGSGKSTFVTQLQAPMLTIDADHRFSEVVDLATGPVFQLSDEPMDNVNPDRIAELIQANMHGAGVRTIVVDSLTAIIAPMVMQAIRGNDQGRNKNRVAAFKEKATAVRLLQDVLTGTGSDVAWIYHIYTGRDNKANEKERTSISTLELARVLRSCNLRLRITNGDGLYKARVVWARSGRSGIELSDEAGNWAGMPERIEAAVYDGLSEAEKDAIEHSVPASFSGPEEAIRWGMDQVGADGLVFKDEAHAKNAYELVKKVRQPDTAGDMWALWVAEVQARQAGESTAKQEAHGV